VREIRKHPEACGAADLRRLLVREYGDGQNGHDLVRSAVKNNLRLEGEVIFAERDTNAGLSKALAMSPAEVIRQVKTARLRGRGGAGFPTGMKWEFTRAAASDERWLICNADEGEPGTFKDRVILTERPDLLSRLAIAAFAIGASHRLPTCRRVRYLRSTWKTYWQRRGGVAWQCVGGKEVRPTSASSWAGAYICARRRRSFRRVRAARRPKNRHRSPPSQLPGEAHVGQQRRDALLCSAHPRKGRRLVRLDRIEQEHRHCPECLGRLHEAQCLRGGARHRLAKCSRCGAEDPRPVVGGPAGKWWPLPISTRDLLRRRRPAALVVFGAGRDPLEIASQYMAFFVHESCGYCTPCRVGNVLLKERLDRIRTGRGEAEDLDYLRSLAGTVKAASRCGLGQTAPNPVLSTLKNFLPLYEARLTSPVAGRQSGFDLAGRLAEASRLAGRRPIDLEVAGEPR
jgi:[NiFe] hydrogenase diaphorase moiety large subunit